MSRPPFKFQSEMDPAATQAMIEQRYRDRRASRWLRVSAALCFAAAAGFITVGVISAWSVYGNMVSDPNSFGASSTGELPSKIWCLYAGLPFLGVGLVLRVAGIVTTVRTR